MHIDPVTKLDAAMEFSQGKDQGRFLLLPLETCLASIRRLPHLWHGEGHQLLLLRMPTVESRNEVLDDLLLRPLDNILYRAMLPYVLIRHLELRSPGNTFR